MLRKKLAKNYDGETHGLESWREVSNFSVVSKFSEVSNFSEVSKFSHDSTVSAVG